MHSKCWEKSFAELFFESDIQYPFYLSGVSFPGLLCVPFFNHNCQICMYVCRKFYAGKFKKNSIHTFFSLRSWDELNNLTSMPENVKTAVFVTFEKIGVIHFRWQNWIFRVFSRNANGSFGFWQIVFDISVFSVLHVYKHQNKEVFFNLKNYGVDFFLSSKNFLTFGNKLSGLVSKFAFWVSGRSVWAIFHLGKNILCFSETWAKFLWLWTFVKKFQEWCQN